MANEKNLNHKLTVSEQREGGKKSGKVRKEKKAFKELAETILSLNTTNKEFIAIAESFGITKPDNKEMVVIGLTLSAIKGNHNAYDRLVALVGENNPINDNQENEHNELIEAIKKRNENK